jgi:uncharacterized membrane protein YheB (UPF0754 family)
MTVFEFWVMFILPMFIGAIIGCVLTNWAAIKYFDKHL